MPMVRSARVIASTASLSAAPGARLKLMVIEGNCSWCEIASGAEMRSKRAKAESGTCVLLAVLEPSEAGVLPADSDVTWVAADEARLPAAGT